MMSQRKSKSAEIPTEVGSGANQAAHPGFPRERARTCNGFPLAPVWARWKKTSLPLGSMKLKVDEHKSKQGVKAWWWAQTQDKAWGPFSYPLACVFLPPTPLCLLCYAAFCEPGGVASPVPNPRLRRLCGRRC